MPVNRDNEKAPQNVRLNDLPFLRALMLAINRLYDGKSNNGGEFSLAASMMATTVPDRICGIGSVVTLQAVTAGGAAATGIYVVPGDKSFVVHHNSDASTSRTFRYVITG